MIAIKSTLYPAQHYVVDTESELDDIPTCVMGSTAIVASTGKTYMVDSTGTWYVYNGSV